ncbi:hypothetical protein KB879_33730 (plasmid) [Cupriavidus sp. KK10]|jgi:hypothetical protein|uniref:hypothetical protein n=1 Tax=Cupriavidus sp. KK10 TaxID=1478019 RepID=UPI001BA4B482|nr:hypothetical protein [Cupriavidus sp. KK10]QUN32576.1 hypothetical protein KB879_33730 [Cupriavidus sp. KK10]
MHPLRQLRESSAPTYEAIAAILAEDVVFNSPLLVRPIVGRDAVARTLVQSSTTRGSPGEYVLECKIDANTTLLRWKGTIDGHPLESLELLVDDANGLLVERTIAFRPYPALRIFRDRMKASLGDSLGVGMWDYEPEA